MISTILPLFGAFAIALYSVTKPSNMAALYWFGYMPITCLLLAAIGTMIDKVF